MPANEVNWQRVGKLTLDILGVLAMLGAVALVVAPIFIRTDTYGQHDWDPMEAHRYLAVKTLKLYHQFPFWNPYNCGGHTWWGGLESGSNVVSPWLPLYLLTPLRWALRLEIVGATLLSAVGTWLLAGRFTRSPGLRLIAVAAFAINGRFGFQIGAGHAWHLYYAWTPWVLFFFDRAIMLAPEPWTPKHPRPLREIVLMGACLAMMVYSGGIYPLPQTIVAVALYAISCAMASRSWRPILYAISGGLLSFAFSAPRLLPIMDMLRRFPRLVDSPETLSIEQLVGIFTAKEANHPAVGPWGYHEFGIYVGWTPFIVMLVGLFLAARVRERGLRLAGAFLLVLGLGRFHDWSPWGFLHDYAPIFESQHVPSRWLYPAALLLAVTGAAIVERFLARQTRRNWLEVGLLALGAWVCADVAIEAQRPLVGSFVRSLNVQESTQLFHMESVVPANLRYDGADWAPPSLGPMMANIGAKECSTFPGLHTYYWAKGGTPGLGAKGRDEPGYRGEVYTVSGVGTAGVVSWSPNAVRVAIEGVKPGDLLVLNQNWDPGWRASGAGEVIDYNSTVATRLDRSSGEVVFRYVPRFFWLGCMIFLLTAIGLIIVPRMVRRRREMPSSVASLPPGGPAC